MTTLPPCPGRHTCRDLCHTHHTETHDRFAEIAADLYEDTEFMDMILGLSIEEKP